jgi:hypothetical protein
MDGPGLEGGLSDEVMELACQGARDFGRAPGARAIHQPLRAVAGQAGDPRAEGGIGQGEGVRDGWQALTFDDLTHGLGTAEHTGFPGLCDEGLSGRERVIGRVQFEGPPRGVSSNKILQEYTNSTSPSVFTLVSAHSLSDSNFPEAALILGKDRAIHGGNLHVMTA